MNLVSVMYFLLKRGDRIWGEAYGFINSLVSMVSDCKCKVEMLLNTFLEWVLIVWGGEYTEEAARECRGLLGVGTVLELRDELVMSWIDTACQLRHLMTWRETMSLRYRCRRSRGIY